MRIRTTGIRLVIIHKSICLFLVNLNVKFADHALKRAIYEKNKHDLIKGVN